MTIKYEPKEKLYKVQIENFNTKESIYFNVIEDDLFLFSVWINFFIDVYWEQLGRMKYNACEEIIYNNNL